MSKTPKKHDPEKLLELFKKSKKVVSTFVEKFQEQNGRKPRGEDLAKAPEYVRVCIKNCKRIKAHLEKSPEKSPEVPEIEPKKPSSPVKSKPVVTQTVVQTSQKLSGSENLENLENLGYKNQEKNTFSQPIKVPPKKSKKGVWGAHLNRSISDITNNSSDKRNYREVKTTSYSGKLSAMILDDLSKTTRKSLSKRRTNSKQMFFETMGDESTLGVSALIESAEISQSEDPLLRFHPELSMDGLSQHGQTSSDRSNSIDDTECEVGQVGGTQTLKTQQPNKFIKETKSMNFLTSVSTNHNVQVTSRNFETREEIPMSFSGLFPKNSNKRKAEDEGLDENKTETEFSSKKQKFCDDYESEEDMFADENEEIDENVQEDVLLPLASVSNKKDEETDEKQIDTRRKDMKSFKANPKAPKNMVSGNFVKIDMKHKNYIHGNKSKMTGAKYKRQEWKRKAAGKFGRKN